MNHANGTPVPTVSVTRVPAPQTQFLPPRIASAPGRHEQRHMHAVRAPAAPAPERHDKRHVERQAAPERDARPAAAMRVISACYGLMAVVTIAATGIGFWLSYAGLHTFAARAGLRGPEAWAWPSSVDLFILAGELGITIATLRDGKADWRAWVYFGAGCGPSVTFNVLHVAIAAPAWGRYAVAATPPVAAMLALAALMQQVISLPEALRHIHGDTANATAPPAAPAGRHQAGGKRASARARATAMLALAALTHKVTGDATTTATPPPATVPPKRAAKPAARAPRSAPAKRQQPAGKRARAASVLALHPKLSPTELAKKAKVSTRTANRAINDQQNATKGSGTRP